MQRKAMHKRPRNALRMSSAVGTLGSSLEETQEKLRDLQGRFHGGMVATKRVARSVNRYSHKNPWIIAGALSAFIGFFGYIMGRRK